jgi:hypothetical protein
VAPILLATLHARRRRAIDDRTRVRRRGAKPMATQLQPKQETLYEQGPATAAVSDKVHDLVQAFSEKLDAIWRYDKYLQDCAGDQSCTNTFRRIKEDDLRHVEMVREEIERLCKEGAFR